MPEARLIGDNGVVFGHDSYVASCSDMSDSVLYFCSDGESIGPADGGRGGSPRRRVDIKGTVRSIRIRSR